MQYLTGPDERNACSGRCHKLSAAVFGLNSRNFNQLNKRKQGFRFVKYLANCVTTTSTHITPTTRYTGMRWRLGEAEINLLFSIQ